MICDLPVKCNPTLHPRTVGLPVGLYLDLADSLENGSLNIRVLNREEVELSPDLFDSMESWLDCLQLSVSE